MTTTAKNHTAPEPTPTLPLTDQDCLAETLAFNARVEADAPNRPVRGATPDGRGRGPGLRQRGLPARPGTPLPRRPRQRRNPLRGRRPDGVPEAPPSGLPTAEGRWYLIAWCRTRAAGRDFRLDRITQATPTDEPSHPHDLATLLHGWAATGETRPTALVRA